MLERRTRAALAAASVLAIAAEAQIGYQPKAIGARLERELPWKGPGSSLVNPASLSETGRAYGHAGFHWHRLSKGLNPILQGAIGHPTAGLAAGLACYFNDSKIDNSNALYQEAAYVTMAAYDWSPAGSAHRFALGLALPVLTMNAFGAEKSQALGLDAGLLWTREVHPHWGGFRGGVAVRNLIRPEAELPGGRGSYPLRRAAEVSATWTSPNGRWEAHLAGYRLGADSESPEEAEYGVRSWALEALPHPTFGWRLERNWIGDISTGPAFNYRSAGGPDLSLEINLSHGLFTREAAGQGRIWGGFISAGF